MKKIVFLGIFLGFLCSCSKDQELNDSSLEGRWILKNAICFCGFPEDNDFSEHHLIFDTSGHSLTIENQESTWFIGPSGKYTYVVKGNVLKINGKEYSYTVEANALTLTFEDEPNIADDELTLEYIR